MAKQKALFNKKPTRHGLTGSTVKYVQARTRSSGFYDKNTTAGKLNRSRTARVLKMKRGYPGMLKAQGLG